jgi:hypothetical protein
MSREDALALAASCIGVLHTRFLVHQPNFLCRIVSAAGVELVTLPEPPKLALASPGTGEEVL